MMKFKFCGAKLYLVSVIFRKPKTKLSQGLFGCHKVAISAVTNACMLKHVNIQTNIITRHYWRK